MKHVKKIKPQPETRTNSPAAEKSDNPAGENTEKSARRPILYARPCIPVDGN